MKKQNKGFSSIWLFPLALFSVNSFADSDVNTDVTLGLAGQETAKYSGSDEQSYNIVPYVKFQHGNFYLDTEKGLGYDYSWDNGFYISEILGYTTGRTDKDSDWKVGSDKLKGMGKIKPVINTSSTLGWQISPYFSVEGTFIAPLTDSQGLQYDAGVNFDILATATDSVVLSSKANFGDARYLNTFYGVSAEQSDNSGYRKYNTGGGFYGYDVGLTWTHIFSDNWWSYANVTYSQLSSKAKKSPIVFSDNNTDVTLGVFYTFK